MLGRASTRKSDASSLRIIGAVLETGMSGKGALRKTGFTVLQLGRRH